MVPPIHDPPKPVEHGAPAPAPEREAEDNGWEALLSQAADESAEEGRAAPKPSSSSSFKILLGLVVVWGSLYLVALAQTISFNEISINLGGSGKGQPKRAFVAGLNVRDKVAAPMDMRFHQTPTRQIVKLALSQAGVSAEEGDLALIPDRPKSPSLSQKPLYYLLHSVIDDPEIGFSLESRQAHFFKQTIKNADPAVGLLRTFDWEATVPLRDEPTLFFPSIRSDLWVLLSVRRPAAGLGPSDPRVSVEIWRGGEEIATGEGALGPANRVNLEFSAGGKVLVSIEPAPAEPAADAIAAAAGARYKLRIFFEARQVEDRSSPPVAAAAPRKAES